jgi:hypothetical protein
MSPQPAGGSPAGHQGQVLLTGERRPLEVRPSERPNLPMSEHTRRDGSGCRSPDRAAKASVALARQVSFDQMVGSGGSSRTSCAQRQATTIWGAHFSASSCEGTSTTAKPPRCSLLPPVRGDHRRCHRLRAVQPHSSAAERVGLTRRSLARHRRPAAPALPNVAVAGSSYGTLVAASVCSSAAATHAYMRPWVTRLWVTGRRRSGGGCQRCRR